MFPLPDRDVSITPNPKILATHALYDYYNPLNWGSTSGSRNINSVIICPTKNFGLFKMTNDEITNAVKNSTWTDIVENVDYKRVSNHLENFVKSVCEKIAQTKGFNNFTFTQALEPNSLEQVFTEDESTQKQSEAYNKINLAHPTQAGVLFDCMRLYYAFKFIDKLFSNTEDYFFLQRLVLMTKLLFVYQLLTLSGKDNNVLNWMYTNNLSYTTIDDTKNAFGDKGGSRPENYALDDMFQKNVELSSSVKNESKKLMDTQEKVSAAEDNLQSLGNIDGLLTRQHKNSVILTYVVVSMLVLQVAAIAAANYMRNNLVFYIVIGVYAVVVLALEASNGIRAILNM